MLAGRPTAEMSEAQPSAGTRAASQIKSAGDRAAYERSLKLLLLVIASGGGTLARYALSGLVLR